MTHTSSASIPRTAMPDARRRAGPRGWRLVRDLLDMRRDRIALVTRAIRDYGDIVHFRAGPRRLVLVAHPDAIRRVLVDNDRNYTKGLGLVDARPLLGDGLLTSEGERWAVRRRAVQPALHAGHLDGFAAAVRDATQAIAAGWSAAPGRPIDLGHDMLRLALTAFTRGVLGVDVSDRRDELIAAFATVEHWAMARSVAVVGMPLSFPTPANRRLRRALGILETFIAAVLDGTGATDSDGHLADIVAGLHAAEGRETSAVRDELLTLLLAGHETTGAALAWTWYCLSRYPEVERRVHEELTAVLDGRDPTLADLPRLVYTRAVVDETLRLYPPVWLVPRRAIGDDEIEGEPVRAGADVLLCIHSLHRHRAFWDDPDRFDPDRFLPEMTAQRPSGIHIPFGLGRRACIGSRLATSEIMLVVAIVAQRFRVRCSGDARPVPSLTLRFPGGVPVEPIERREPEGG
jgi:cytochrome P450